MLADCAGTILLSFNCEDVRPWKRLDGEPGAATSKSAVFPGHMIVRETERKHLPRGHDHGHILPAVQACHIRHRAVQVHGFDLLYNQLIAIVLVRSQS